jgi:hypothetical protein
MSAVPRSYRRRIVPTGLVVVAVSTLLLAAPNAGAQVSTWTSSATTWENPASWNPSGVPAANATAQFADVPAGATGGNVFLGQAEQIGQIQFASNARAFFFIGSGTLTINAPGGTGIANSSAQPQEFAGNPQYILGASQTWTGTGDLIFDQPVTGPAFTLSKTGTGSLAFTGNSTLTASAFNANGGSTVFDNPQGCSPIRAVSSTSAQRAPGHWC